MRRMEIDLETRLDWVAVDHWDTDNPHTHIVLNGRTADKEDLVIAPDYMAHGMRLRASEIVTEWLGPRTEAEMRQRLLREVDQQRLTSLDRALIRQAGPDGIDLIGNPPDRQRQNILRARLQRLEGMGLAERVDANRWKLQHSMGATLNAMGEREDALDTMRRALKGQQRELVALKPRHAQRVDHDVAHHVVPQRPAHYLAAEQVYHHRQEQPAFVRRDVGDVAHPDLVRFTHGELAVEHIGRDWQIVAAVGGDLEAPLASGADAVPLHELLNPFLAHAHASGQQLLPDARPAVAAECLGVDSLDVHQQGIVTEVAPLGTADPANEVLVIPGHADMQHPALHRDRPHPSVALHEGVLHRCAFAKYAVAFSRMSRYIFTGASSARSRLISLCSALTTLLSAPMSLPSRCALT